MFGESWPAMLCADWSPEPSPNKWSAFEIATAPFQYALSTRAGSECIAHVLQTLTDTDPNATVLSIDGIGAFDLVSREAMLRGFLSVEAVLPFVRQFYGTPSTHLWQDDEGTVHDVQQGEGGEQGDALMPALFALGQHDALVTLQLRLGPLERLFAFLDDIHVVCSPDRVLRIFQALEVELWVHSRIQIHQGKTPTLEQRRGSSSGVGDIGGTRVEV